MQHSKQLIAADPLSHLDKLHKMEQKTCHWCQLLESIFSVKSGTFLAMLFTWHENDCSTLILRMERRAEIYDKYTTAQLILITLLIQSTYIEIRMKVAGTSLRAHILNGVITPCSTQHSWVRQAKGPPKSPCRKKTNSNQKQALV